MIIVAHQIDEVQRLCHSGHVVGVVDGLVAGRDGGRDQEVVFIKLASHLAEEGGVVFFVLREPRTVFPTT